MIKVSFTIFHTQQRMHHILANSVALYHSGTFPPSTPPISGERPPEPQLRPCQQGHWIPSGLHSGQASPGEDTTGAQELGHGVSKKKQRLHFFPSGEFFSVFTVLKCSSLICKLSPVFLAVYNFELRFHKRFICEAVA